MRNKFQYFLSNVLPILDSLTVTAIPSRLYSTAQEITLSHFGLKTMGQLRDAYEGQVYFNKILKRLISAYCIEKMVGTNPIDSYMLKVNRSTNITQCHVNSKYFTIVEFIYGELPAINRSCSTDILIFCISKDYKKAWFFGKLQASELESDSNFHMVKTGSSKNSAILINYKLLSSEL